MRGEWVNDPVVQRFREYLKIPSVHPDIDYGDCVVFLKQQANEIGLPVTVYELVPGKPIVVITWTGLQPKDSSILLNSHMDVVPVYEEYWSHPPFEAVITDDGFLYGRGTQDMKGVGMMHLETIRRLKTAGVRLKRTIHMCFVPDEETGGTDGMRKFSESEVFKKLNVGFCLDESMPSSTDALIAFNGERTSRQIKITCKGVPGHGSLLESNTAGEKLHYIVNKFMTLRAEEKKKLDNGAALGEVTTINLTQTEGGVQINVLPENLSVSFDIRIAPEYDHDAFEKMITRWCKEAGDDVIFEYIVKNPEVKNTKIDGALLSTARHVQEQPMPVMLEDKVYQQ
ncbi:aminoacylase-1-like isoform X2 [Galleria mellonella]|uniref:N-acyl-aliphatic-L-amino acid amidohydrolase n=1 Tax=Galleria mellonella TaxID=7137 RepID=A0A6J3CAT4_GALME|nr:aminoacylase-1-like isoform X2 [Galleria mellonella]